MGGTKHQAAQARILVQLLLLSQAVGTTYFLETFEDDDKSSDKGSFKVRWVESKFIHMMIEVHGRLSVLKRRKGLMLKLIVWHPTNFQEKISQRWIWIMA